MRFTNQKRRIMLTCFIPVLILIIPYFAMHTGNAVKWSGMDFLVAGVLLGASTLSFFILVNKRRSIFYVMGLIISLFCALLVIWANLAVGLLGTPDNPVNFIFYLLLLGGVIIGLAGKFSSRALTNGMRLMSVGFVIFAGILMYLSVGYVVSIFCTCIAAGFAISAMLIAHSEKEVVNH